LVVVVVVVVVLVVVAAAAAAVVVVAAVAVKGRRVGGKGCTILDQISNRRNNWHQQLGENYTEKGSGCRL
jgi:hypothetical protein